MHQNNFSLPDISIIIVNYKGWKRLKQCLDSLVSVNDTRFTFEVIIIDNQSDDGQLEIFIRLYPSFTFICNAGNLGFASGCNRGAANSHGSCLLFLNPDTKVSGEAIFSLWQEVRSRKMFSVVSCVQVNGDGSTERVDRKFMSPFTVTGWMRAISRLFETSENQLPQTDQYIYPDWVSGSVVMISKQSFDALGGWDEDFWMYYEDVDFCYRAKQQKGDIVLQKNVTIEHNHGGASRINSKTTVLTKTEVNISRHVYVSKHESGWRAIFMHTILVTGNIIFGLPLAVAGIIFFFIQRLHVKARTYLCLIKYYFRSLNSKTWLSERSVNYNRNT